MYAHVSHFLHLIEQGKSYDAALAHTTQRFGVSRDALVVTLADAHASHQAKANLLFPTVLDQAGLRPLR